MNRNKLLLLALIVCLSFTGCNSDADKNTSSINLNQGKESKTTDSLSQSNEIIVADKTYEDGYLNLDFETRYGNIKNQYPDKTILVWAIDNGIRYEDEVNQYLTTELDSEYVICFKDYSYNNEEMIDENGKWIKSYSELLEEDINNDDQIDIISTGTRYVGYDTFMNPYKYFAQKGWFEPLDNYLAETGTGTELTNLTSSNYWDGMRFNGIVYGFDGTLTCLGSSVGYSFNSELCDNLEIDINEFRGSYESTINNIFEICENNDLQFSIRYLDSMRLYSDYDFITSCIYIDDEGKAANIYESSKAKKLFNIIEKGFANNCVATNRAYDLNSYFGELSTGAIGAYSRDGVKTSEYFGLSVGSNTVEAYTVYPEHNKTIHAATEATGICSSSMYKDMAFDALSNVMTNRELNNLICYGSNYNVVDGCARTEAYYNTLNVDNMLIRTPLEGVQSPDMNKLAKEVLDNSVVSPFAGFYFDTSNVAQQILDVESVVLSIPDEFPSEEYSDADEYLDYLNKRLYDAGLQDILDDANRQLEDFK